MVAGCPPRFDFGAVNWLLVARYWVQDAGSRFAVWVRYFVCRLLDPGCWMLLAGCWILDTGCLKVGFVFSFPLFWEGEVSAAAEASAFAEAAEDGTEDGSAFA